MIWRRTSSPGKVLPATRIREPVSATTPPPWASATPRTTVTLLDGGAQAYPRMLRAIGRARRAIHLEVYAFTAAGVGGQFVAALAAAARRGVAVRVELDGWGSVKDGRAIAATLTAAGCAVRIYHRLRALLRGRFGRNHRKLLVIDGRDAFIGGINIGDENLDGVAARGWADVAVELRGPAVARLARRLRHQAPGQGEAGVRIWLSGLGGGRRLRARYLAAIEGARRRIDLAHGYFLPDPGVVRALIAAAARDRGDQVIVHVGLWHHLAPRGLARVALALAEALTPIAAARAVAALAGAVAGGAAG